MARCRTDERVGPRGMRTSAFVVLHAKTQMKVSWFECLRCRRREVPSVTGAQVGRKERQRVGR